MKTIACLSQKGGVGKSTLARLVARSYAASGWRTKIADFNTKQKTSVDWASLRLEANIEPVVAAEAFNSVKIALRQGLHYDMMVFDGRPDSEVTGREIAKESDLIILPVGVTLDDLTPQVRFAHELLANGIERQRLLFVINKSVDSQVAVNDARSFVEAANYLVAKTDIPIKTGYQMAQNTGRAMNETNYATLNDRADSVAQEIADRLTFLVEPQKVPA